MDFEVPRLYVLDGGKALFAGVKHAAGKAAIVQRCQVHKTRNVIGHLTYAMREYSDARRGLDLLHRELMHLNPSAASSLEEGMEDTLAVHRLRVAPLLRTSLASTNVMESSALAVLRGTPLRHATVADLDVFRVACFN